VTECIASRDPSTRSSYGNVSRRAGLQAGKRERPTAVVLLVVVVLVPAAGSIARGAVFRNGRLDKDPEARGLSSY
jgi:hypothetical protein